ncbi:MAG: sugar MFS transporter [Kangiellaceae bacterium]|nr:sugar MFS transporter [Kangiellaceae bacterium]
MNATVEKHNNFFPMVIIGILFFIFGFVTWLNGSLIPFLKIICNLNDFQALFVTFAFYIAYFVMALPMSYVLKRTGYRNGMALGLLIMAVGSLLFIPAAFTASYSIFLVALFVLGTGLTILQTASNPYVVLLGPNESAAMRISIMGLINKGAGVIVPIVFTAIVLSDLGDTSEQALMTLSAEQLQELSSRLVMPYLYMAITTLALIALVKYSHLPEIDPEEEETSDGETKSGILQYPQAILGALALFCYVGVEVIAGDTIGLFGADLGVSHFAILTSYTMVFMVFGYIIGVTCIPKYLSQKNALIGSGVAGTLCILGVMMSSIDSSSFAQLFWGWSGIPSIPNPVFFVALMGLAHALVWPSVWPLALKGLGRFTAQASALLIMGIAGGAILPLVFGRIAETSGDMQSAYWIAIPCYLFILFYALKGHKMRNW